MAAHRDGRLERGARSRRAVADALLALLRDGVAIPTAAHVAERAGVSLRLVHHHFRDREALFAAAMERQREHLAPFVRPVAIDAPFADRVREFVVLRSKLLEQVGPIRRAGLAYESVSPMIRLGFGGLRALKRNQVAQVFSPELDRYRGATRADLLAAACAASSWSNWEELRNYQGLSIPRARRVMRRTLSTLFEGFE